MKKTESAKIGEDAALKSRSDLAIGLNSRSTGIYAKWLKRPLDMVIVLACAPFILPFAIILCFMVKADGGPFLFGHERIGRNGRKFKCLKFRTMIVNAEEELNRLLSEDARLKAEWDIHFKLRDDPRVTRIGRLLRKTSLDELPQLINILKGEMSFVGPRPITQTELEQYDELASEYTKVRPGLTGPWQISGRRENDFSSRAQLDADYVANISLGNDLRILVATVPEVIFGRGR